MRANVRDGVVYNQPKSIEQREAVARDCAKKLEIGFPMLLDSMDNRTEQDYSGWPDRLYLIDREGKVAYKSRPGPAGFKVSELGEALEAMVGEKKK